MAEADNLIDKAVNRVEFAALIISLVKTLNDDKDLADSVRAAVQSTRGVPVNFDERTTSGDLMKKLVKAGLHEHSDDHIAVAEPVKRLVKKGYSTGGRCQAVADLFQLHTLPIPSTDGRYGTAVEKKSILTDTGRKTPSIIALVSLWGLFLFLHWLNAL